jgi:hypothetical protein
MRYKIPDDKKKGKMTVTVDNNLIKLMEKYLDENNIKNISKYVESLVRKDLEQKGIEIKKEF